MTAIPTTQPWIGFHHAFVHFPRRFLDTFPRCLLPSPLIPPSPKTLEADHFCFDRLDYPYGFLLSCLYDASCLSQTSSGRALSLGRPLRPSLPTLQDPPRILHHLHHAHAPILTRGILNVLPFQQHVVQPLQRRLHFLPSVLLCLSSWPLLHQAHRVHQGTLLMKSAHQTSFDSCPIEGELTSDRAQKMQERTSTLPRLRDFP
ncbi:hypothetical protein Naga_100333g3 [Nannochloropsis gaditana]|uniref:Uncharacterized protein n=1 Tax=Nannochloropsis gaditana TaxID=72520 RepID=W7TZ66_9STRA|nr:hypothetical protein Naga_100333g3 [Nannochloropsis gaditana]